MVLLASAYDQSRYFKAADLAAEQKLRIKTVTEEIIGTDKDREKKLVVWFTNDERGLVLNRVNNRTVRGAFGDEVEGWTGKIIVVFPTMAEFRGKMGPALRVRIPPPKQAAASASSGNGTAAVNRDEPQPAQPQADDLNDDLPW
jgi:hypothetical protein